MPGLSVVRGGASASPWDREFEIAYVDAEADERRVALTDAWSVPFEECLPVRGFLSYKGQRNHVGCWWTAPFWLFWTTPEGKPRSHVPDYYFAGSADGAALGAGLPARPPNQAAGCRRGRGDSRRV
ncbi:hypothetical protein [Nocardia sp. GAS34]|uniref:hypothetical protein n=1 Tax=unclassified Nocardia TaxID=2637762 RepID=UPI003D21B30E